MAKDFLHVHSNIGRPPIEETQPDLLRTIVEISLHGSAAEGKRQDESIRSVKTLSELHEALLQKGFQISRSSTYLRLLPRRSNTEEGKRHLSTVPVKLLRATNDQHSKHQDGEFCTATINMLEELSSLLGPNEVAFVSQDDKARIAIGITAANKQSPLLMHMEYRVKLPDHDWVVANRHKLIPSVYAGIVIKPNGMGQRNAVGYSGPTYVAIRSGKHSSSTAYSHGLDYEKLLELQEFADVMLYQGNVKPVHVVLLTEDPMKIHATEKLSMSQFTIFVNIDWMLSS
ncbi:uncharacterized protein LOC129758171 [Uranotaenia lowii]|uniref:uncharacterized protein LOC129758171 n=1 Tax=Uranotaenia lowii TaxID=190385 RepID=UPI00247A7092|nr:uncharacterized protein LOC129758171 [Uranotaenia lowii]